MILCDTNILSAFAKIDQLGLLLQLFAYDEIAVVPAVYEELQEGLRRGYANAVCWGHLLIASLV